LRDNSGSDLTDALVLAIPKLPAALRAEAEDALTERLSHLTIATLRDKIQDDNLEVRRAAAFACGRKLARDLIPDLVQLLEDPQKDVIQAARAALTELTGEDFGPSKEAKERGRSEAVAAWRKWCKEHTSAPR
jgi:HEAT repeat protein